MEHPNDKIDKFDGTLALLADDGGAAGDEAAAELGEAHGGDAAAAAAAAAAEPALQTVPITIDNVLLRGCTLRSVAWLAALVVNTGPDTKIMMSNQEPPVKDSSLVVAISRQVHYITIHITLQYIT